METQNECLRYNYYPMDCINIRTLQDENEKQQNENVNVNEKKIATYQGKINQPNLSYKKNNEVIHYQSKELRICNKIHQMNQQEQEGEIMILHTPTTSSLKLYACFPFLSDKNIASTDIDKIFFSNTIQNEEKPLSLEMNQYIHLLPKVRIYETYDVYGELCHVVFFEEMIHINHKIHLFLSENMIQLQEKNRVFTNYPFLAKTKNYQDSIVIESKLRSSFFLFQNTENHTLSMNNSSLLFKENKNTELIKEGMENNNNNEKDEVIYSCEYLPIDSEDMVQVLQVPLGSPGYSNLVGSQVSNLFINNGIFMFIVILFFCLTPFCYNFFYTKIKESNDYRTIYLDKIDWSIFRGTNMNLYNLILLLIVFMSTLLLLIWGFGFGNETASSIGLFLPFSAFIGYLGISFFYKNNTISSP